MPGEKAHVNITGDLHMKYPILSVNLKDKTEPACAAGMSKHFESLPQTEHRGSLHGAVGMLKALSPHFPNERI
jgi:hypothetical protein